jgi:F-type H+-transporting ATPase subunit epsilon
LSDIKLDIVTPESIIYSDDVQAIVAPGIEGDLGILPNHTPLITTLRSGVLMIRKDGEELHLAVFGGFLEVRPNRVIVLADAAERHEEIDREQAEKARRQAEQRLSCKDTNLDMASAEAQLRQALVRLKVIEKNTKRKKHIPPFSIVD